MMSRNSDCGLVRAVICLVILIPLVPVFALGVLGLSVSSIGAQERPSSPEYREATNSLVCQCGCYKTIDTCDMENCHSATPIREEVWKRLQSGESVASIIKVFTERYGLTILSQPPTSGFHLSAWIMPFLFLAVGAIMIRQVLLSWKKQSLATPDDAPIPVNSLERARIEKELRDLN